MIQIKLSPEDGAALRAATEALARAGEEENKHKKAREVAKAIIERELKAHRKLSLEELPAGEFVLVQIAGRDVLKVDRRESARLDGKALASEAPELAAKYTRPSVASYFCSLLQ